jgi:hypothetical protein
MMKAYRVLREAARLNFAGALKILHCKCKCWQS